MRILVLGGSGFVGSHFLAALRPTLPKTAEIVALSRRGTGVSAGANENIKHIQCDASDPKALDATITQLGPFNAYVHAIGALFDDQSGLGNLNRYVSGSQSVPDKGASYDIITRQTAFNLLDSVDKQKSDTKPVVIFISAAEAGWSFKAPVSFLERYLVAKRAVESRLLSPNNNYRPVIFRPSIIWTWNRPIALASMVPFYTFNFLGIPFVDRPVRVEELSKAMVTAMKDESVHGVQRYKEIDNLAAKYK